MTIKIDKNVKIPGQDHRAKYPWDEMEVGDSFFAPGMAPEKIAGAIAGAKKKYNAKFTTRTVVENGVKGVRVWRIK